jgi:hypothetical protein
MEYREYLGDNRLRHRIVYKNNESLCIYCGNIADSREHIPSKVFLEEPFPDNLYLVPACRKCNNSFSDDELYTWYIIKILEQESGIPMKNYAEKRFSSHPHVYQEAQKDISDFAGWFNGPVRDKILFKFQSKRVERVIEKLAIGHAVFELGECYFSEDFDSWKISKVEYAFAPALSQDVIEDYDCAVDISNNLLPEIGSRVYENIYPVTIPLCDMQGNSNMAIGVVFLDWTDIQDNIYRYIAIYSFEEIKIMIVIDEFLYTTVIFRREDE